MRLRGGDLLGEAVSRMDGHVVLAPLLRHLHDDATHRQLGFATAEIRRPFAPRKLGTASTLVAGDIRQRLPGAVAGWMKLIQLRVVLLASTSVEARQLYPRPTDDRGNGLPRELAREGGMGARTANRFCRRTSDDLHEPGASGP